MLSDRLQQDGKQREGENVLEAVRDLQHAMSIVGQNARPAAKMKGSRFAHTEKLLYSKVS